MPEPLDQDTEYRLAVRLLQQEPRLDLEVLEDLVGERRRYGELKRVLRGRNDNVLTKVLRRLQDEGLVQAGLSRDLKQKTYGLSPLGKLVVFRVHEMVPHHESIRAYERGLAA
jgi:DNA-binding HxlR family transcriptional regulator